jgi:UDP-N-acetylmuramoyl-tripeptide--D-alanyl-D-alanine ligase
VKYTLGEVAAAVDGVLHNAPSTTEVTSVVSDSRDVSPGALFIAISGERVDGHDFAAEVIAAGCVAVLAARPLDVACIVVPDPVQALGRLAQWHRDQLSCTVVGITGSSGKTTTKDLVSAVLEGVGPTVSAVGSLNTEVGLPLTILRATNDTAFLVLEMGMRGTGHIAELVEIARPDIAVLINAGTAHIELLGSTEAILAAKAEIFDGLGPEGWAIVNGDDPRMQTLATEHRRLAFGESAGCDVRAEHVHLDDAARASFELVTGQMRAEVTLSFHGEHYVSNALAAAAVGVAAGMDVSTIATQLNAARVRSPWRMAVSEAPGGYTVINDAYNANPESTRAALKTLAAMKGSGRAWAVLGEMRELGPQSVIEHDSIGRLAVRLDIDRLVCVGPATRVMHLAASNEGSWGEESSWVPDVESAIDRVQGEIRPGDVVLVKASRSIGLETVANALLGSAS